MKMSSNTIITLLIAAFEFLWLQDVSVRAAPFLDNLNFSRLNHKLSERLDSLLNLDAPNETRKGPINYFGSRTYQRNNVYGANDGKGTVYGSQDVQIGNSYSGDPDATNVYGPILVQENNTYRGKNENAQYGASVSRAGNSYDHNRGKNDIYDPIIIQSNNTYHDNIKNNSVLEADVKPSGHDHSPSQHHPVLIGAHVGLGMKIKEHEEMKTIIFNNLKTDQPSSKRCANGMVNSERLDEINSLYLEVETQIAQLRALKEINHNRKIICNTIPNQCSKHDRVRHWIARSRQIVTTNANRSKTRWESLRRC
ncbi:Similar to cc_bv2.7_31.4 [Cotesia congregata]|uniref:Similar to cc_bv2.7_31.4 n=1 Tax=Cotesia congregata TaxID=51543 RepID=A0A8J2HEM2_COTCN|nr:Similar to cc_bv2.7_31.4 [Cotesia congregata]